ncbi:MAG: nucleotidyltransferase [Bacillota bacterium]|nr:nucleotidyltransferase [Bacillota bacterium]
MNISSIIAEYNPLHKGHEYHINETKSLTKCDGIICVMSGNFVQRGEPAILDKWSRTRMALSSGIDLVIELPAVYSLSSAEFFSFGSVSLLDNLGVVDSLCFGSESGKIDNLMKVAKLLQNEPVEYKIYLKEYLNLGDSFPKAREKALNKYLCNKTESDFLNISDLLKTSNNILGIEYCKSLIKLNSKITPFTVKRMGSHYNSTELSNIFSSATAIRKNIGEFKNLHLVKEHVSPSTYNILEETAANNNFVFSDKMLNFLKYKIFTKKSDLERIPDVKEGLHNKITKHLSADNDYYEIVNSIKSKRYTHTRISRILTQLFCGFEDFNIEAMRRLSCPYARVLGFNKVGLQILKQIKQHTKIPVYTKLPKQLCDTLVLDINCTKYYSLLNSNINPMDDYKKRPIIF